MDKSRFSKHSVGHNFGLPPSPEEMVFLVSYMLNKKLLAPTIRSYLSAIRFYLLAQGVHSPASLPPLAEQLIQGRAKLAINPSSEATKKTRRAITLPMLKLLENAIANRGDWSVHERSLRWSVILLAWWGSFRIGELLHPSSHQICKDSGLLASDVTYHPSSIACWIRCPKVQKSPLGDTVEVWQVDMRPDLDPVRALKAFSTLRNYISCLSYKCFPGYLFY